MQVYELRGLFDKINNPEESKTHCGQSSWATAVWSVLFSPFSRPQHQKYVRHITPRRLYKSVSTNQTGNSSFTLYILPVPHPKTGFLVAV